MQEISIRGILTDLENGLTRTTTSQGYVEAVGSIETKYNLSKADVKEMFTHELLKNRKTRKAPNFRLVDDVTPPETATPEAALVENVSTPAPEPVAATQGTGYITRPVGSVPAQQEATPTETVVNLGAPEVSPQSQF